MLVACSCIAADCRPLLLVGCCGMLSIAAGCCPMLLLVVVVDGCQVLLLGCCPWLLLVGCRVLLLVVARCCRMLCIVSKYCLSVVILLVSDA